MRTITMLMMTALLFLSGCPDGDSPHDASVGADLSNVCSAGAEQPNTAHCQYGHDTICHSTHGYDCHCACTGYWECDQVKTVCDPDAGMPHD